MGETKFKMDSFPFSIHTVQGCDMWSYHPNLKDSKSIMTTCIGNPEATNNLRIKYNMQCVLQPNMFLKGGFVD